MRCDFGSWKRISEVAPHSRTFVRIELDLEVDECNHTLELGYEVGGGGGHELHIKRARLRIIEVATDTEMIALQAHGEVLADDKLSEAHSRALELCGAGVLLRLKGPECNITEGWGQGYSISLFYAHLRRV